MTQSRSSREPATSVDGHQHRRRELNAAGRIAPPGVRQIRAASIRVPARRTRLLVLFEVMQYPAAARYSTKTTPKLTLQGHGRRVAALHSSSQSKMPLQSDVDCRIFRLPVDAGAPPHSRESPLNIQRIVFPIDLGGFMVYRNGNYTAFYVAEPFSTSALGAHATKDFCCYNLLRSWKGSDSAFPFIDSHDKTYNVRDDSNWELTLKPRLRERIRSSKNIVLFLSSDTKNSRALREEIDYGINDQGLPVIVIYPEYGTKESLLYNGSLKQAVRNLWDNLPIFRVSMSKVPTLHVPMDKSLIKKSLDDRDFMLSTKTSIDIYRYNP
ncbi:TIR domain-containing protein [Burkholderia ambifaria]